MKLETRHLFEKYTDKETFDNIKEYETLVEMLDNSTEKYADEFAITDASGAYTYRQLERDVAGFRGVLKANGIKAGSRVGIIGANSYSLVKAFLAVTTYGCTAVISVRERAVEDAGQKPYTASNFVASCDGSYAVGVKGRRPLKWSTISSTFLTP